MFVTFEGVDFCGKSTQVSLLKKLLEEKEKEVILIREPGGTVISEKIREILLDKKNTGMSTETEFLLFSASRAQLVREVIIPLMKEGKIIISDRYHDSMTAYQGFGRGIPKEFIWTLNHFVINNAYPDITFYLDISIEEMFNRKASQTGYIPDRMEQEKKAFFREVREGYLFLAGKEDRIILIDGTLPIDAIHNIVIEEINKATNLKYGKNLI